MPKERFKDFLEKFPIVDLPVTLTEESHLEFSMQNSPLTEGMVRDFIIANEDVAFDEYTEFIPCLRIPQTDGFHAVIYWRAGLMDYEYTLATFTEKGAFVAKKVIAGTKIQGGVLVRSVATIQDDWLIYIVIGQSSPDDTSFKAIHSRSLNMELLATGEVVLV